MSPREKRLLPGARDDDAADLVVGHATRDRLVQFARAGVDALAGFGRFRTRIATPSAFSVSR